MLLLEIAKTLAAEMPPEELLAAVTGRLADVLEPAEIGAVRLWDAGEGWLRAAAARPRRWAGDSRAPCAPRPRGVISIAGRRQL